MADDKKTIGAFWGNQNLYFLELNGTKPHQTFALPLISYDNGTPPAGPGTKKQEALNLPIQDKFYLHNITSNTANLALPTKEIIFRSFIIPWMQSNELKQAVQFEARKYLPFDIDELLYTYHSIQILEEKERHFRIIFVAIKKNALESYTNAFDLNNIQIPVIEPAAISLVRALLFKKIISDTDTTAIVEKDKASGKIVIAEKGIPQFVREFHLHSLADNGAPLDDNSITLRLINEIRISLDYFNRQEPDAAVTSVILLTNTEEAYYIKAIKEELNINTIGLTSAQILGMDTPLEIGFVHAFGVALSELYPLVADFSLLKRKIDAPRASMKAAKNIIHVKPILTTAAACAGILALVALSSKQMTDHPRKSVAELTQKLGALKDVSIEKLNSKNSDIKTKLGQYKSIRLDSHTVDLVKIIPSLLPEGAWLKSMEITYPDSISLTKREQEGAQGASVAPQIPSLSLDGHVYREDTKGQITLVNQLLRNLKQNESFAKLFKIIKLDTAKTERIQEFTVTTFRILCN